MSELYTESYKQRKAQEDTLMQKWDKALNADGGIKDQHMARTTAILLENYMTHLKSDPSLIAEDRIQTNTFKGVNLALLGLIRRAVPSLVGSELVGMQAMPTPNSPIFYMSWRKSFSDGTTDGTGAKGTSTVGDELYGYPTTAGNPMGQADPYFTSEQVRSETVTSSVGDSTAYTKVVFGPLKNYSVKFYALDSSNNVVASAFLAVTNPASGVNSTGITATITGTANVFNATSGRIDNTTYGRPTVGISTSSAAVSSAVAKIVVSYEYAQESNKLAPEMTAQIDEFNVKLIRRMLRGRFSLDSVQDAKAYHGIALENELMEVMKFELMNEINREIVTDLRSMAAISGVINYNAPDVTNVVGNYDDTHKLVLDKINGLCAEILNQTRAGRGNCVVGNAVTLSFLDRVPGFVGSGVSYDGKGLSFAGQLGKRINFYIDPQFPKNELLIGYKGSSALDTGYIHAPYLPITTTPTLYDPLTGDPGKIFYTRYGKTYQDINTSNTNGTVGAPYNAIFRGEYFYARMFLNNFPTI